MKLPSRSIKKMHRVQSGVHSDWELLEPQDMNRWQQLARRSHGVITPGNLITLTGSVLVVTGLIHYARGNALFGVLAFGAGRIADVLDGDVSELTKTKSVLGASVDAGADWLQLAITLPMLVAADAMPLFAALVIGTPKIIDAASTIAAKYRRVRINVTGESKLGAAFLWFAIGLFMIASGVPPDNQMLTVGLVGVAWLAVTIGTILRAGAVIAYARLGFGRKN